MIEWIVQPIASSPGIVIIRILFAGSLLAAPAVASAEESNLPPAHAAQAPGAATATKGTACGNAGASDPRKERECRKLLDQTAWTYDADDLARDVHAIEQKAPVDRDPRRGTFGQPAPSDTLSADIEKAARPDCRTAYQGLLLLAIPFLIKDTLTGTGCKW